MGNMWVVLVCLLGLCLFANADDRCTLQPSSGTCPGYFPRWFYNSASGQCQRFIYSGCKGNANNYLSEEECHQACVSR
nr:conotoxin precursor conkunitzin [Conus ebraeus]